MALRMITTSKVVFMTFDVLFNVVIFVVVINSKDIFDVLIFLTFDVRIALINLFDVLIVYGVFGVLFGFRPCDFRSSDHSPSEHVFFFINLSLFTGQIFKEKN